MKKLSLLIIVFLSGMLFAQSSAPKMFFTDLDSGPVKGGENNQGAYVCVFGVNFGATRGTSTITVGGVAASSYAYWGTSGTNGPASDKACFQMGASTPTGTQNVVMTVNGAVSNTLTFTVRTTGSIYCVDSINGSDSNNGKFVTDSPAGTGCKATLSAGYSLLKPGDTVYVKSGTYQTNGYGNAILWLNGSGTAGNPKALVGYPGSSSTIGFDQNDTYTYGIRGGGAMYGCDYHTIANLQTIHAGAGANQGVGDAPGEAIAMNGCSHVRVIGNRVTNPFQNNQEAAMGGSAQLAYPTVYEHAYNAYLGNEVFNTGTSVPARLTNYASGPYTITGSSNTLLITVDSGAPQTIVLNSCNSCSIDAVVADLNSKLTGATAYSLSGALIKIESKANLGGAGRIVLSAVANSAYSALALGVGTYYGGANKQTHSVYFGTNSHDIEAGWNNVHDSNACRAFQMHSSPLYTQIGSADPTGMTMYNMSIHDNYIHNVACDAINFASVDPSLGYVRAYNNVIWHVGTGLNQTHEGGMSGVYVAHLANKMYQTANTGCTLSTSGTSVTGSAQCHFKSELKPGWSICNGAYGTDACVSYSATIASITDDTHMTLLPIPSPYNRNWVLNPPGCDGSGNCTNLALYYRKTGVGAVEVYNNTFYDAGASAAATGQSAGALCRDGGAGALTLKATNNIVYQLGTESFVQPQGCIAATSSVPSGYWYDPGSTNNVLYSSGSPTGGLPYFAKSTIQKDPLFKNAAGNDFSLQPSSPAIDAGSNISSIVTQDLLGLARPQNSLVDIGAFEYAGGSGSSSDTTPPTLSIISPSAGAVSGTITLTATCTDNVAVKSLQFTVDGANFGSPSTAAGAYSLTLDTNTLSNGNHNIGAACVDSSQNSTTATPITVSVLNSTTALAPTAILSASSSTVQLGTSFTLAWQTTNASTCSINQSIGVVSCGTNSVTVTPTSAGAFTYTLTASGAGGTITRSAQVTVTKPSTSTGFSYKRSITINHTQVAGNQTGFPVMVSLTDLGIRSAANGGHVKNGSGYDISFYSDSALTMRLPAERESYDPVNGKYVGWIKANVSSTVDTVIYMAYGNGAATSDPNSDPSYGNTAVWDTNFRGVWHLADGAKLNLKDSSSYGNNGTNHGATPVSGQNGGAAQLNVASSQFVDVGNSSTLNLGNQMTVETWVKWHTFGAPYSYATRFILGKGATDISNYYMFVQAAAHPTLYFGATTAGYAYHTVGYDLGSIAPDTWHHVAGVYDGTALHLYVDGNEVSRLNASFTVAANNRYTYLGAHDLSGTPAYFTDGNLDEVRISSTNRSASWIKTEYNNQISPTSFYILGGEASAQ